jgi:hypothetical protein
MTPSGHDLILAEALTQVTAVGGVQMNTEVRLDDSHTVPTRYWHRLDDGRIQCDVCLEC